MIEQAEWSRRADRAEAAIVTRHLSPLFGLPGTALGRVCAPAAGADRWWWRWHYWWQAHLLDAQIDAWQRDPTPTRRRRIRAVARAVRIRNGGRWTNSYHDDIAWLGLALHRGAGVIGPSAGVALGRITRGLVAAWRASAGAGIPWRVGDRFRNAPANGPAAMLLARTGHPAEAAEICDWIFARLLLPSGLIADGIADGEPVDPTVYTYCQGVALGAALAAGADRVRIHRLVAAVATGLTDDGVVHGGGGHNGGLFAGILVRNLALVADGLSGSSSTADRDTARLAAHLVLRSAEAAWDNAAMVVSGPVFGPQWSHPARVPAGPADPAAERDLSVQLSGWLLMEAAAGLGAGRG